MLLLSDPDAPSSKGNEFVLAFFCGTEPMSTVALLVTTDEAEPVSFTVNSSSFSSVIRGEAVAGQTTLVRLSSISQLKVDDIRVADAESRDKGIYVKAEQDKKISVYGLNDQYQSTDGFLALPCHDYGEHASEKYIYYVFSANASGISEVVNSRFLIIPCEDDTTIGITSTQPLTVSSDVSPNGYKFTLVPNNKGNIKVNRLKTVMFETQKDLTGTILESDKPVTVIVGHQCGQVPGYENTCDLFLEQVPPHITYGQLFFTTPLQMRESGETYRVGSVSKRKGGNRINITCTSDGMQPRSIVMNYALERGKFYQFSVGNTENRETDSYRDFCCIETEDPATVMQYTRGHPADEINDHGDPAMLYVPPVSQFSNVYTVKVTGKQGQISFKSYNISFAIASQFFVEDNNLLVSNGTTFNPGSEYLPIYCSNSTTVCGFGALFSVHEGDHEVHYNQTGAAFSLSVYGMDAGFEMEAIGCKFAELSSLLDLNNR